MGETTTHLELRQQSVPHSGVRKALLAPMAAPALPDAVRNSSSSFKNQNSTFINRQFFLCHADGDKSAAQPYRGSRLDLDDQVDFYRDV